MMSRRTSAISNLPELALAWLGVRSAYKHYSWCFDTRDVSCTDSQSQRVLESWSVVLSELKETKKIERFDLR